jgi:hypothetical protein
VIAKPSKAWKKPEIRALSCAVLFVTVIVVVCLRSGVLQTHQSDRVNASLQAFDYVSCPNLAQRWAIRFQVQLFFPT